MNRSRRDPMKQARREGRSLFWSAFLFSIFVNLLMLTGPLFMLQVYDRVLASRSVETLVALFALVAGLMTMMGILDWARGRAVARIGGRMQETLDGVAFSAGLSERVQSGQRKTALTALRDVEAIQTFHASPVYLALMDLPWSPLFFAIIFVFHPWLGALALAGAGVLITAALLNQVLTGRSIAQARQKAADADQFSVQTYAGSEIVLGLGMSDAVEARWREKRRDAMSLSLKSADWTGSFSAFARAFRLLLQSAILAAGAYLVLQGDITAGAMIAASIILGRALAPIEQSLSGWPLLQRARSGWNSLKALFAAVPQGAERTALPRPEGRLEIKDISLLSPNKRGRTLSHVTLSLSPGTALGVIGRSGSGKSTLAKVLVGLVVPDAGIIRLGGPSLDHYDPASLASHIGYLPQEFTLFDGTISEYIARMAETPDADAVVLAAKRAAVHDLIVSLEDGYDTVIDGANPSLSGGQRQRIALARALYGDTVLLVLDEPNSALDSEGSDALHRVVHDFKSDGRSVVIMPHRPMAISECDNHTVKDEGRVTAEGPRDEILRSMLRYSEDVQRTLAAGAVR